MKSKRFSIRIVFRRSALTVVLCAPLVLLVRVVPSLVNDEEPPWRSAAVHVKNLIGGRITEEAVLTVCVLVMLTTWLRMVWVFASVVVSQWRGRDIRSSDRFLTRLVARALVLTPVVLDVVSPRAQALAPMVAMGIEEDSRPLVRSASPRDVLLVSVVTAVGVSLLLRRRRNAALREDRASSFDSNSQEFECEVIRRGEDLTLRRMELAVHSLVSNGHIDFRWLVQHSSGIIHVECGGGRIDPAPWTRISEQILVLDAGISTDHLEQLVGAVETRCPILLPIGTTSAGSIWLNLECARSFFVEGRSDQADAVWNGLCQSIALSPLHTQTHLIGTCDNELFGRRQLLTGDDEQANDLARILHDRDSPSVVLVDNGSRRELHVERRNPARPSGCGLVMRENRWFLLPMDQVVQPTSCIEDDRLTMRALLGEPIRPLRCHGRQSEVKGSTIADFGHHPVITEMLSEVSFITRTMGRPSVDHVRHGEVAFERARSEELVVWLALHPQRRRRSTARAELWNVPIKDSTFSNITSDVRRSLTAFEEPPGGEQWLSVTMNDELPLHPRIVTDVSVLTRCLEYARRTPEEGGIEVLSFGLEFVRACPLEGSRYLWRDATGLTTDIAMLIIRASVLCAEMALEQGDTECLYRVSAKGLAAVPGHEGLVSLRMRQHAENRDRASLVTEWESYCRAIAHGDWGDSQPSAEMVELWLDLSGRRS